MYLAAAAYSDLPCVETDTKPLLNNGSGFLHERPACGR